MSVSTAVDHGCAVPNPITPQPEVRVPTLDLLTQLRAAGAELWEDEGALRYRAPQGALTPDLHRLLREHKDAILALIGVGQPAQPAPVLADRSEGSTAPLSFSQQRLWFLDRFEGSGSAYNVPGALQLRGRIDLAALERSFTEVVRRHDILRSRYEEVDGAGVQRAGPAEAVHIPVLDLSAEPPDAREDEISRRIGAAATRPFDLARGPVFRVELLRLAPEDHVLVVVLHHIVADAWSMAVLTRELGALYGAFCRSEPSPLSPLPLQFADFAQWQRDRLRGQDLDAQAAYWARRLAGAPQSLNLPTDRPRPPRPSYDGARIPFMLPHALSSGLANLARQEGATLFMSLLAAFGCVLSMWSGQADIVVGSPVAGREAAETEGLIGCFVNTLALRIDLGGQPTFRQLLRRLTPVVLGDLSHQRLPFEHLVAHLAVPRDRARHPVFQAAISLQNTPQPVLEHAGLEIAPRFADARGATVDLELLLRETPAGIAALLEYATDLFDAATVSRLGAHFVRLLELAVENPDHPVDEFDILSSRERCDLLQDWNAPRSPAEASPFFAEHVARHAATAPTALAVVCAGGGLSYAELEARSNQLAHHLRALGLGAEVAVGLCFGRSSDLIVALIAAHKAGAAFLCLDPDLPSTRLGAILADAAVPVILADAAGLERLPTHWGRTIDLGAAAPEIARLPTSPPPVQVLPGAAAYLIYTSGSTGAPKGVTLTHGGLRNLIAAQGEVFGVAADDQVLQFARQGFDAFVFEAAMALGHGATLHLADAADLTPGPELADTLCRRGITIATLPPTALPFLQMFDTPRLRLVIAAGEALPLAEATHWSRRLRLINAYGPTEATVWSTWDTPAPSDAAVRIGRPIAGAPAYVVTPDLRLAPVGVPGELCLAGAGLARGYLGEPALTAERFVPDPFGPPGSRLYRTGDLARWTSDGRLDFLGRLDHQVKVHGFRIEPGEIEAHLAALSGVARVAVVAREDRPGDRRLVAYVVSVPGITLAASELRASLRRTLPDYMVPSAFVQLDALPLNANGKLDRQALPPPDPRPASEPCAPGTPVEDQLARIWAEVLGVQAVSIHDNFFELGGDSIQCIQVAARARQAGIQITVAQMFEQQSVAGLAAVAGAAALVDAEQGPIVGDVPLTPIQLWYLGARPPEPGHYNQSLRVALRRPLPAELLDHALRRVVEHHDILRARFAVEGTQWRQWIADVETSCLVDRLDLSMTPPEQQLAALTAAAHDLHRSLDLAHGPLLRLRLFDLGGGRLELLWVIHHLVVDAVSWRVLAEDFQTVCLALDAGREPSLPPKSSAYRAWARRLAAYATTPEAEEELAFWTRWSDTAVASLPVPGTAAPGPMATADTLHQTLSADDTRALLQDVPGVYHTQINDALLTALTEAWGSVTGRRSLVVALEAHGREDRFEDLDLSRTVGWFTSLFPVALDTEGASDLGAAIKTIKEQLRATQGRGVGFGVLRYLFEPAASALRVPDPPISFNYLGQVDAQAEGSDLFELLAEPLGGEISPALERPFLLDVNAVVQDGRLHVRWSYNPTVHPQAVVARLADGFLQVLRDLVAHCAESDGGFTPSDFDLIDA